MRSTCCEAFGIFPYDGWRHHRRTTAAISKIFIGPIHTFHDPPGHAYAGQFWYETTFWRRAEITDMSRDHQVTLDKGQQLRRRIRRQSLAADLEKALVRYARALDLEDHDPRSRSFWSLMEFLTTDTGLASYDKTVQSRVKFLYVDVAHQGRSLSTFVGTAIAGAWRHFTGDVEGEVSAPSGAWNISSSSISATASGSRPWSSPQAPTCRTMTNFCATG